MFCSVAGIDIQHVPHKGSASGVTDVIGGQIQIMFDPLQSVLSNVQAGRLRALAVSSKVRSPVVPDVPTIAESGYDNFETTAWWGVFAPAKLPEALTASRMAEIEAIAGSGALRSKLEPLGVTGVASAAPHSPIIREMKSPSGARPCGTPASRSIDRHEAQRRGTGHVGGQGWSAPATGAQASDQGW